MAIGRGLGALITPTSASRKTQTYQTGTSNASERLWQVPISEIKPNPKQPRRTFNDAELDELAESIKEHGILQPILVSELASGGYQIIAGERRWRAAGKAGLTTLPVIVKELADEKKLEVALIENIQRANLNPIEEAFAYQRLIEEFGLTQEQVANKVGKSRPAVANTVRLLALPEEVQTALMQGKISSGQGRALLALEQKTDQLNMLASMLGEKITVRELERTAAGKKSAASHRNPNMLYIEEKLRATLGTKVTVNEKSGKGTITIHFFSKDELADLLKKIAD